MNSAQKIGIMALSNEGKNGMFWSLVTVLSIFISLLLAFIVTVIQLIVSGKGSAFGYTFLITIILSTIIMVYAKYTTDKELNFDLSWLDTGILSLHTGLITGTFFALINTDSFYYGFVAGNILFAIFLLLNMYGIFKTNKNIRPTWKTVLFSLWTPYALLLALIISIVVAGMIKEAVLNFWRGQNRT